VAVVNDEHCQPACPAIDIERQVRPRPASPRAAPWRDMTRPTLDEMPDILIEAVPKARRVAALAGPSHLRKPTERVWESRTKT
jgi:hypothetical protein